MEKVKKRAKIHFISIDDSDSESDNDSRIDNTEIINKERKERTIFAKTSKQEVTESALSQIFRNMVQYPKLNSYLAILLLWNLSMELRLML